MCITTVGANEALYIIRPSQSQSRVDQCSKSDCADNDITLSQFVNNFTSYLTNDTSLVFSPGNYSLESELVIEHIHSFSMSVWPMKAVIICSKNARFEFRNISAVSVSGLELVGCFENRVVSVGLFQLENSKFFGNGQAMVNGRVLIIEKSTASLNGVVFISALEKLQTSAAPQELSESCPIGIIETVDAVIGILLNRSNIRITQSWFEGNKVGLGAVVYDAFGSDIIIFNTTFINNSAAKYCNDRCCFAGGIVYVNKSQGSTVKLYHCKFEKNFGVAIFSHGDNMYTSAASIIHCEFVNNTVIGPRKFFSGVFVGSSLVYLDPVMMTVSLNKFINNRAIFALVYISYQYTAAWNFTNNVFSDNSAAYEIFFSSACQPGLALSLGSIRCIECTENWRRYMI